MAPLSIGIFCREESASQEKQLEYENLLALCHDAAHANELAQVGVFCPLRVSASAFRILRCLDVSERESAQAELHRAQKTLEADRKKRVADVQETRQVIEEWLLAEKR